MLAIDEFKLHNGHRYAIDLDTNRVDPHRLNEDLAINQVKRWLMKREFSKWVSKPTKL